jgi:hypothetical protein
MAKLLASRSAQYLMEAEFTFNFDDTIVNAAGVTKTFGSVFTDAVDVAALNLPEGAVVVGGEAVVEVQGVGPTAYTVSLGDSVSATRYLSAFDLKGAVGARTALTLTGFRTTENLRLTINSTVANASAGKATIRVFYVQPNRANEVNPN